MKISLFFLAAGLAAFASLKADSVVKVDPDFRKIPPELVLTNYKNEITFKTQSLYEKPALYWTGPAKKVDTAWGIRTQPIDTTGFTAYRIDTEACSDYLDSARFMAPDDSIYAGNIQFKGADGKIIETRILRFRSLPNSFLMNTATGTIPSGTKTMTAGYGADIPDMTDKHFVALSRFRITLSTEPWKNVLEFCLPKAVLLSESPESSGMLPVRIQVTNGKIVKVLCDGKDVTGKNRKSDGNFSYLPDKGFAPGLHKFVFTLTDKEGRKFEKAVYTFIGKKAEKGYSTIRKDGVVLIDGKPFFPIGIFGVRKNPCNSNNFDNACKTLKEGGFNLIQSYSIERDASFEEYLKAAEKYGLKIMTAGIKSSNDANIDRILNVLLRERLHPALFLWYIGDDTADHNAPAQLAERTAAVKAVAPHLLTGHADAPGYRNGTRFQAFADTADAYMPEIYPVTNDKSVTAQNPVAKTIYDMQVWQNGIRTSGAKNRTCWALIQYFKGWGSWKRFPTPEELRGMVWAAVIHGSKGITIYTYAGYGPHKGCAEDPEHWKHMCAVTKELNTLADVLVQPVPVQQPFPKVVEGPAQDYYKNPSVSCLLHQKGGKKWLFAVNSATQPVRAQFCLPGVSGGEVLFEDGRTVALKNGILEEHFSPQSVHIYELR